MRIYTAHDDTGEPAEVRPVIRHRTRNRQWFVDWHSGRAPDYFRYLSDAKGFVQRCRPDHRITGWTVRDEEEPNHDN
jgi:hypothetical protein